jgi:hypothetical protein
MGSFGVNNGGYMDMPMYPANMSYGDPMFFWYQDYCARLQQQQGKPGVSGALGGAPNGAPAGSAAAPGANMTASPTQARPMAMPTAPPIFKVESKPMMSKTPVGPFKWWQDPRAVFGPPGTKEVLNRAKMETAARQEGAEVESAPLSEDAMADKEMQPPKKMAQPRKNNQKNTNGKNTKKAKKAKDTNNSNNTNNTNNNTNEKDEDNTEAEDRLVAKPTRTRRPRKRLLKDPVAAASSGTSGPLPHYSSDGVNPRQHDAVGHVAKLLLSISTKEAGVSSGSPRPRRRTSRKSSG